MGDNEIEPGIMVYSHGHDAYEKTLGMLHDALYGSAIGLVPLDRRDQGNLANFILLIMEGKTFEEAKATFEEAVKCP